MTIQQPTVQRQYDQVIAPHYDDDPQFVLGDSQARAIGQLRAQSVFSRELVEVLDIGMGTGRFLETLQAAVQGRLRPFGLDLSEKMIEIARQRLPELQAAADDAANLDSHFPSQSFDLICTHFITGFVPMAVLAPKIFGRLKPGGFWSLVAGTKAGFPALRAEAERDIVRKAFGGKELNVQGMTCNPAGREEVVATLEKNGFSIAAAETFEPQLKFQDVEDFLAFGYRGGWLTPFIEALGLHQAGRMKKLFVNFLCFPLEDQHNIEIVLARKSG